MVNPSVRAQGVALVSLSAILFGLITVGGKFFHIRGLSLFEISIYPSLIGSLLLFPAARALHTGLVPFFLLYGLVGACLQIFQFGGIVLGVPVAVVALLLYTQPLWTTILGRVFLKERIEPSHWVSLGLALLGVVILIKPWQVSSAGPVLGLTMALLGGLCLSLWVVMGRIGGLKRLSVYTTTFGVSLFTVLWLVIIRVGAFSMDWKPAAFGWNFPPSADTCFWMAAFCLLAILIPHLLFYKGVREVSAAAAGVLMLLEPLSAGVIASLWFREPLGINVWIGGTLVLGANAVRTLSKMKYPGS